MKVIFFRILLLSLSAGLSACGTEYSSPFAQKISERNWNIYDESPAERAYCNTTTAYDVATSRVSGNALFEYRDTSLESGSEGLTDTVSTPKPVRHAQFEVTDGTGKIIQCGETTDNGGFEFLVPQGDKVLSLKIYSRSFNEFNKASVFKAPETNELYSIDFNFVPNRNHSVLLTAKVKSTNLLAGAFFILDQIHSTFDRLKELTAPSTGAVLVEDIPKVDIYWEKGFNPGLYINVNSGISYFSPPQNKLFILGGLDGDIRYADTDHFDPSIIIHEYFHFLENTISRTDSPGGAHNGDEILDPRLAWSEGAAQFFQAAITGRPSVIDTRGNPDGATGFLVKLGLESGSNDLPSFSGEADFREFVVARFLWDIHDNEASEDAPETEFDQIENRFPDFWEAFANKTKLGLNSSSANFRSLGLFMEALDTNLSNEVQNQVLWANLMNHSMLTHPDIDANQSFRGSYGLPLLDDGPSTTATFNFRLSDPIFTPQGNIENNNPVTNMNFHSVQIRNEQTLTFNVIGTNSPTPGNLTFYIFSQNHPQIEEPIDPSTGQLKEISIGNNQLLKVYNKVVGGGVMDEPLVPGDYLIVPVLITIPGAPNTAGEDLIINYSVSGFTKGSL